MLGPKEMHERLKAALPEAIGEFVEEKIDAYTMVQPEHLAKLCARLKSDPELAFNYLVSITAIDQKETLAALYHLESVEPTTGRTREALILKAQVPREQPHLPSVAHVWATADWQERECFDLMGIVFDGHPNLTRILCAEDWEGHPLRKDYVFPTSYRGIDLT